jgi:DNA polymerase elongation subunit (family B)
VNKKYTHLVIDLDKILRTLLLLKKKKYAAIAVKAAGDKVR